MPSASRPSRCSTKAGSATPRSANRPKADRRPVMQLPGGIVENGHRRRDWAFRPVSGALELALAEAGDGAASTPAAVTQVLAAALDRVAGEAATPPRVAGLCVVDRQFLMRELDRHL